VVAPGPFKFLPTLVFPICSCLVCHFPRVQGFFRYRFWPPPRPTNKKTCFRFILGPPPSWAFTNRCVFKPQQWGGRPPFFPMHAVPNRSRFPGLAPWPVFSSLQRAKPFPSSCYTHCLMARGRSKTFWIFSPSVRCFPFVPRGTSRRQGACESHRRPSTLTGPSRETRKPLNPG